MKRFLLVVMLFASAASLYAAELKVSGDAEVRGVMDGVTPETGDEYQDMYFDYDFNLNLALVANENATVNVKLTFDQEVSDKGTLPKGNGTALNFDALSEDDSDFFNGVLNVERAYINYKFFPFLQMNAGIMEGGAWGTAFNNNWSNIMRVQGIGALSEDMVFILTYEKVEESEASAVEDQDDDDTTAYYAAARLKFGAITVMPLLVYGTQGIGYSEYAALFAGYNATFGNTFAKTYDASTMAAQLAVTGDMGMIGFEAEVGYKKVDTDGMADDLAGAPDAQIEAILVAGGMDAGDAADLVDYVKGKIVDSTTYGAYINVFAKIAEGTKVGVAAAYGSSDDTDGNFTFGYDFDFTLIYDDVLDAGKGAVGTTAVKLYGEALVMPKVTVGGCAAYYMPTDKDVTSDYTAWEVDANATYAFDANASYTVAFGYGSKTTKAPAGDSTDVNYELYHSFNVKF